MSVNITVSGKFSKKSKFDPEGYKKQLENERRKLRLQQVREQSKEFARKIRTEVAQEKARQLRNMEAVKAQEMNLWRKSFVAKKKAEFQKALSQVGSAQLAARKEIDRLAQPKKPPTRTPISRRNRDGVQKECEKPKNDEPSKAKTSSVTVEKNGKSKQMNVCFDENQESCMYVSSLDSFSTEELLGTCDFCTSSSLTSFDLNSRTNSKTTQTESVNGMPLKRAPTVLLDVDALQTVSEHVQIPTHICDNHVETNRQYISVVCVKPIKESVATQTIETMAQNVENTTHIPTDRPRYTQISDLIAKQKSAEQEKGSGDMADTIIEEVIEKLPPNIVDKPSSVPVVSATEKENIPLRITSSVPSTKVSPKKRTRPYPINRMPSHISRNSTTTMTTTTTTGSSKESGENAVKFYDYNNKYAKEYAQPPNVVSVIERNSDELNAMERAELERQRTIEREKELEILMKKSDERGKLALEREKVRRDCIELTAKLDALVENGKPLLPTDANLHSKAYYSGQTARKEAKMNSAIEELLTRPTIITLPEVRNEITTITTHRERDKSQKVLNSKGINVDTRLSSGESDNAASKSTDTDGSGSILLGYIDDQRDQIRSQLSQCEGTEVQNLEKRNKLTQLLQRIEALRGSLMAELQKNEENEMPSKGEKQKKNIPVEKGTTTQSQAMDKRERELKDREIRLQNELAEVIQIQKKLRPEKEKSTINPAESNAIKISAGKEQRIQKTSSDAPLEIVIKVKGDIKRPKRKEKKRSKSVENEKEKQPAANKAPTIAPNLNSRCSYDSNSTHYQSIPSVLPVATEQFVERMKQLKKNEKKQSSSCSSSVSSSSSSSEASDGKCAEIQKPTRSHLNPLIAQYIQRLLGMSRQSVRALEVSSSEIETPSSSIINMTTNKPISSSSRQQQGSFLTDDQLKRVEEFVNENRSFINELEESIRTQSNTSLESSLRRFEEIWRQKLKDERTLRDESVKPSKGSILKTKKSNEKVKEIAKKPSRQETESQPRHPPPPPPPSTKKIDIISQQKKSQQKESKKSITKSKEKSPERRPAPDENYATQAQLNHYAELTKNCSNRIAELTALINKVREEKQRIMENTLTSVSDNGRNSTEYAELPQQKNIQELNAVEQESIQNVAPLEKHKQTGRSRDSGISMQSRPVTALGYDTAQEPISYASTNTQSSSTHRKQRPPPPTMQRYSPQLPDDEVVHELSTIIEVDTPVTSRINASSIQATQTENTLQVNRKITSFPTFEQYCKDHNLDVTTLDPEQSMRMEHEYNELVEAMKDGYGHKAYNYEEFPTLTTYLDNLTGSEQVCQTAETLEDLFGCLRLAPLIVKPFPSHKDYTNRLTGSPEGKLIDSASLENLTETRSAHSEGESETLDIESELKRRNILKQSFRSRSTRYDAVSSSTCEKNQKSTISKPSKKTTTVETGIEKLTITTSSDSASEKFQRELLALGLKWHKPMRNKEKEAAALSSTSCSPPLNATNEKNLKSPKKHKSKKPESECLSDSESSDHPLNLRDFLTRQLMKHVAATASSCGSSSLSGDSSLRSQFFMAVLDSMSPSGSPRTNTNTGSHSVPQHNLERQKTSTPVQRSNTNIEPSKSPEASQSQLFSNESNMSLVQSSTTKKLTSPKSKPKRRHEKEGKGQ